MRLKVVQSHAQSESSVMFYGTLMVMQITQQIVHVPVPNVFSSVFEGYNLGTETVEYHQPSLQNISKKKTSILPQCSTR